PASRSIFPLPCASATRSRIAFLPEHSTPQQRRPRPVAESTAGSNSTPQGGAGVPTIPNPTPPWSRATESWDARPPGAIAPDRPPALFPAIARAEWQALLLVGAVILLLTQVPPTVERLAGPTDRI